MLGLLSTDLPGPLPPTRITMSTESPDRQQQKINEFLRLLPLTLAIAGLPDVETGRHLNEGQMEVRATALRNAYKVARQVILDIAK
jgi:hypothetical protein